ncbi:pepSY-associated TM helix family protein [Janthinobacterium agaricidamnosum NBRC 102515 = DSM 9628]|uniref:PepSY-associated TM helix family protein n=2 Tax=Janthinobacterium agaricidamnosum TaxID=55508 RepID=W0V0I3_9BURK|nr:pepSY-associated TM helix family protein [Janthinobacterium agaricidamnosum NBRC 102515 = DSM 9628]
MAWLHTWVGLWFSWLLFAVFLTGTLAVFEEPIGHWMTPEHALAETAVHAEGVEKAGEAAALARRGQRLQFGVNYMRQAKGDADMWELWPVNRNSSHSLDAYWLESDGGYGSMRLDPLTGAPLPMHGDGHDDGAPKVRATQGGRHFVDFHYELHSARVGLWIVAIATMGMLVALVSGIVVHKRIFKDFFTFRPAKGQRSWLDAHNALAVLTIPFLFMIAYTGLAFYGFIYLPAPVVAQYGLGPAATQHFYDDIEHSAKPPRSGVPMAPPELEPFAARAAATLGQQVRAVVIDHPQDAAMRICVYGWNEQDDLQRRINVSTGMMCFAGASGAVLQVRMPGEVAGAAQSTRQVMSALHMASFGGLVVKWLYFLCGLAGAAMMGSGAVLFMVKRRQRHGGEFGSATQRVYRLIEGLNVAAIAGLALACIGYLWANRLLPAAMEQRADWEVRAFFLVWLLSLVHALLRPAARAWPEQLAALVCLCLLLPLLNWLSTGDHLAAQMGRGDWESAGVELASLAFAALAGWAALLLNKRRSKTASKVVLAA